MHSQGIAQGLINYLADKEMRSQLSRLREIVSWMDHSAAAFMMALVSALGKRFFVVATSFVAANPSSTVSTMASESAV
jgi:hypothetical protein